MKPLPSTTQPTEGLALEPKATPFEVEDPAAPAVGKWYWLTHTVRKHTGEWEPKAHEDDDNVPIYSYEKEKVFACVEWTSEGALHARHPELLLHRSTRNPEGPDVMTTDKSLSKVAESTELEIIRELLARRDVSTEFRAAAERWEKELASGKYLSLTEKQRDWLLKVRYHCEAHDIGVATQGFGGLYGDEDDFTKSDFDPNIGDR